MKRSVLQTTVSVKYLQITLPRSSTCAFRDDSHDDDSYDKIDWNDIACVKNLMTSKIYQNQVTSNMNGPLQQK